MKIEFCKPTEEDARYVIEHLSKDEKLEIFYLVGDNALSDLLMGMKYSQDVGCCKFDGKPVAIYGAHKKAPIARGALAWAYFTNDIKSHRVISGRHMKKAVEAILRHHSYIYNYVPIACRPIIRWLKSLGAKFYGPIKIGALDAPHWYFEIRRDEKWEQQQQ